MVLDLTVFGSSSNALVFTSHAAWVHNSWASSSPGLHTVRYDQLDFTRSSPLAWAEIALSHDVEVNLSATSFPPKVLQDMLQRLQRRHRR